MNKVQFEELTREQQEDEIINHGVFVGNYFRKIFVCDIYRLHGFYVKFIYSSRRKTGERQTLFNPEEFNFFENHYCQLIDVS